MSKERTAAHQPTDHLIEQTDGLGDALGPFAFPGELTTTGEPSI
jgi:hypothetical protein